MSDSGIVQAGIFGINFWEQLRVKIILKHISAKYGIVERWLMQITRRAFALWKIKMKIAKRTPAQRMASRHSPLR
jgi:hypothetical protein